MVCRYVRYEGPWAYYINCVLWLNVCVIWGLWIYWFHDLSTTIPNGLVTIGRTSLVGVGHSRSDSIVPLMLRTVCCAMAGALALYYRFLGTALTLLRRGNISGRPCMGVMTYNVLTFSALKALKTLLNGVLAEVMPSFGYYSNCKFIFINWAHVIPKCEVYLLSL
jgi:hypothetical protein